MGIERINPPELVEPLSCTHIARVTGQIAFIAGQGPYTKEREFVGKGDYYAQAKQVMENLLGAIRGAGAAGWGDVAKAQYFIVGLGRPEAIDGLVRAMHDVLGDDFDPPPAASLVGVEALYHPDMLIEIDAVVALP